MKRVILMSILIGTFSSFVSPRPDNSIKPGFKTNIDPTPVKEKLSTKDFIKVKIKDFEKYTGKKLTLKEKIAFIVIQYKLKKEIRTGTQQHDRMIRSEGGHTGAPAGTKEGKTALIMSIAGLVLLFVPYGFFASLPLAIIAIIMGNKAKKADPSDKKARAAVILGWVTLALLVAFIILSIVIITSGVWWI